MGRPFLALGLVVVAALLLGSLFAELEDSIEDPDPFTPDPDVVKGAAEKAAAHPEYLKAAADAGAFELGEGGEITVPPGAAEVDGDLLRLLAAVDWTLPADTAIEDLTLPLAPGTHLQIPDGTEVDGDTLVFPPGSTIVLDDGTLLDMPEGGRLRVPGAHAKELRAAIAHHDFVVPESGAIFTSPHVRTAGDWPVTLPEGTTFRIPEGMELPQGTWKEGGTFELPAGERIDPDGTEAGGQEATATQALFDRLGAFALKPSDPEPKEAENGGARSSTFPALPGGALWYWLLGALVAAGLGWLGWRHRHRLRRFTGAASPLASADRPTRHPFRAVAAIAGRPDGLPLAVAPENSRRFTLRFERVDRDPDTDRPVWTSTTAHAVVRLGADPLHEGPVGPDGVGCALPALPSGDHTLRLEVRIPGHKSVVLEETVRVAPWAEQVARDYDRLANALHERTRLPDGFTPRTLERQALPLLPAPAHAPLSAALTVFERANYGRGDIDEATWQRMAETIEALRLALDAGAPSGPVRTKRVPVTARPGPITDGP